MKSPVGAGVRTQKVKHGEGLLASAVSETGTQKPGQICFLLASLDSVLAVDCALSLGDGPLFVLT